MDKKEAMKILKDFHDKSALFSVRTALDTIIPELKLKENNREDERIIKALIQLVNDYPGMDLFIKYDIHSYEIVKWLDKQGEQVNFLSKIRVGDKVTRNENDELVNLSQLNSMAKSTTWSEEDERNIKELLYLVEANYLSSEEPHDRLINFLESLKGRVQPKQEWSKEDEYNYNIILYLLNNECVGDADKRIAIEWFKSLRP